MTTGDALFAAVLADPTDPNARTVYAEWLEDSGQPETAAWWRGEEAARLMPWLKALRDIAEAQRKFSAGLIRLDYTPGEHSTFPVFEANTEEAS